MTDDLRILLTILMNRFDGRVEITPEEAANARMWLADHDVTFITYPTDRLAGDTFIAEMRHRSRMVLQQ